MLKPVLRVYAKTQSQQRLYVTVFDHTVHEQKLKIIMRLYHSFVLTQKPPKKKNQSSSKYDEWEIHKLGIT
jgi:hypothetical protein